MDIVKLTIYTYIQKQMSTKLNSKLLANLPSQTQRTIHIAEFSICKLYTVGRVVY